MNPAEALELVWTARERNERPAAAVRKQLTPADGYRVQLGVLDRLKAKGETHVGWKIGGNSDPARALYGPDAPFSGFLLQSGSYPSGSTFDLAGIPGCILEFELLFTFGKRVAGPGATREQVRDAVVAVAPAIELAIVGRVPDLDVPQLISDGVAHWGIARGADVAPYPRDLDLAAVQVTGRRNGELVCEGLSRANVDNQLDSMAWLADNLAEYGLAIEAGQTVLSGACLKYVTVAKGDSWRVEFEGIGVVEARFS